MIPILFQKDELNFTSNGLGRLVDMVDCEVSEELNGSYEIEFQYPIDGALFDYMIKNGGVVYSTHDDAGDFQAFDIDGHTTPIDGLVTFRGKHISYRLNKYVINPFTASSCAATMAAIKPNSQPANMQFSFWTDKSVNGNFELTHPVSARAILGGAEGSILDVYGKGEYKFNNFNVMLYTNRGIDSGVTIRYGKNLLDLNREYDASETYTAIAPYWEKDGVTVYVPGLYVLSSNNVQTEDLPWTDQNGNPILGTNGEPIYFRAAKVEPIPMDFTDAFEEAPTPEVLAQKAREYLDRNKPWLPNENIEIDFVALWQTPEYENVAALQRLSIGDKASVYYPEVNLICEHQKIIKTVYGPLEEKYRKMEFGNLKSGLGETIIDNETNTIVAIVNSVIQSTPALQAAITHATELIRGGLGGHVVIKTNAQGEPEELLIMDTDDINTAVNVWRWNQGGLGHSHNGYNGPYSDVALTMDGRINANMITTGLLNAELIKAGVLSDEAGRNYWNMVTGEFSLQGYATETYADQVGRNANSYADLVGTNANSYTDQVFSDLDASLNQQAIFNRLTNNGQTQGIYLQNGKIYINGTYIQAGTISANRISGGTLTLGGSNNTNGVWKVNDANGNEIARGDKDGITSKALTATDYIYLNGGLGSYLRIPLGNSVDEFLKIEPNTIPFIIQTKSGNDIRKCSISVDGISFYDNNGDTGCSMSIVYGSGSQFSSWGYDSADASDCETRLGINEFVMHDKNDGTSIPPFHIDLDYDYPYLRFYDRKRDQNILYIHYGQVGSNRAFELAFGENLVYSPLKGLIITAGNVIVRDSSNNMVAKIGKSASTGSPELQLGGTTLSETQLQRLLALLQ